MTVNVNKTVTNKVNDDNWLFIFQSAPREKGLTADGLDLCLVAASFGMKVKLLFLNEGVRHIIKPEIIKQQGASLPSYTKTFKALADFEINQCFMLEQSLYDLNLVESDFTIELEMIETVKMHSLLHSATEVFNF